MDSPEKDLKFFESQTTPSPTWSQPRSFERWRLRDLSDSQSTFGDGKAGLEAEAEGYEPGEGLRAVDGDKSPELENGATAASSMTEAESQDMTEWLLRTHPELKFGGRAPPYESAQSGSPGKVQGHSKSHGGTLGESTSAFSQLTLDRPLMAFLDMFEGGYNTPQDSQLVTDIDG